MARYRASVKPLAPDDEARMLSVKMLASDRTMRAVLDETITAAENGQIKESGRTACGAVTNLKDPLARFPKAIDLSQCSVDLSGTYHSHVTTHQMFNPSHSLPDMANVVFGGLDVSVIVGAETADVLVEAQDREAMAETMQNVLGIESRRTMDVIDALETGEIPDPAAARRRMRREFSSLLFTHTTDYRTMAQRISALEADGQITALSPGARTMLEPMYEPYLSGQSASPHGRGVRSAKIRSKARRAEDGAVVAADQISSEVIGAAVSTVASEAIRSIF